MKDRITVSESLINKLKVAYPDSCLSISSMEELQRRQGHLEVIMYLENLNKIAETVRR